MTQSHERKPSDDDSRKPYAKPELEDHGSVEDLTRMMAAGGLELLAGSQ